MEIAFGLFIGFGLSTAIYLLSWNHFWRQAVQRGREIERYSQAGGIVTNGW